MKKTIQIHIGGEQFHIDDDAFNILRQYLDALKLHFNKEGETGKEIISDIEQRIAELLKNKITESKQVVTSEDVNEIIKTLGSIEDFEYEEDDQVNADFQEYRGHRRFYRDGENNYVGGVAAGLAAYFNIDPIWIRLAFIALFFVKGIGLLIYAVLWIIVPKAITTSQKLEMKGKPVTISTIEKSIAGEYQSIKSSFSNWSQSERTRNAFQHIVKAFSYILVAIFKFLLYTVGIVFLIAGSLFLVTIVMLFLGHFGPFHSHYFFNEWIFSDFSEWISNPTHFRLLAISLFALVFIPVVSLIYAGIKILFHIDTKSMVLRATALTAWILALILFLTVLFAEASNISLEAIGSGSKSVTVQNDIPFHIIVRDNIDKEHIYSYSVFGYTILHNRRLDEVYGRVSITFIPAKDQKDITYSVQRYLRNISMIYTNDYLDDFNYYADISDSTLILDKYFEVDEEDFWRLGKIVVEIKVPVNACINFDSEICSLLSSHEREQYCEESHLAGKDCIMTSDGLVATGAIKNSR